jgi:hypothetical protein
MTWIDNNGDERPQSWEEYLRLKATLMLDSSILDRVIEETEPPTILRRCRTLRMRPRLYSADPHCFWCGIRVYLNVSATEPDFATVDHLYSRFHPEREIRYHQQKGILHVLACRVCNQERASAEEKGQPFIPKLSGRAEFAQLADATRARKAVRLFPKPRPMRVIQTLEEAVEYAREHPGR